MRTRRRQYRVIRPVIKSSARKKLTSFLDLPHNIRQKIYTYSLCIEDVVDPFYKRLDPYKPPAPGLLRTNKQIYHEAIDMVYSKNIFDFTEAEDFVAFQKQIGLQNCKQVREISIWIKFPTQQEAKLNPKYWPQPEYDSFLTPWLAALTACRFEKIVHLRVDAFVRYPDSYDMLLMPNNLQDVIEKFFLERMPEDRVPRLSLIGFQFEERKKFPESWKVEMEWWDEYDIALSIHEENPRDAFVKLKKEEDARESNKFFWFLVCFLLKQISMIEVCQISFTQKQSRETWYFVKLQHEYNKHIIFDLYQRLLAYPSIRSTVSACPFKDKKLFFSPGIWHANWKPVTKRPIGYLGRRHEGHTSEWPSTSRNFERGMNTSVVTFQLSYLGIGSFHPWPSIGRFFLLIDKNKFGLPQTSDVEQPGEKIFYLPCYEYEISKNISHPS